MAPPPTYPNSSVEVEPGQRAVITLPDSTTRTADIIEADLGTDGSTIHIVPTLAERGLPLPTPCPVSWATSLVGPSPTVHLLEAHPAALAADLATAAGSTHDTAYFAAVGRLVALLNAAIPE